MKNFYLRFFSSVIIAPIFIYALYEKGFFLNIILFLIISFSFYEIHKNVKQFKISSFLYFIICFFVYSLINVRGNSYEEYIICIWILSVVWISDISGYFVGKKFQGPKLSKHSPGKTISGLAGSILFSQLSFLIPYNFLNGFVFSIKVVLIQFLFCLISVYGDIFFSYVKRLNSIKDYSNFIPGHGGVLDRIDGMIFTVIFYYLSTFAYVI